MITKKIVSEILNISSYQSHLMITALARYVVPVTKLTDTVLRREDGLKDWKIFMMHFDIEKSEKAAQKMLQSHRKVNKKMWNDLLFVCDTIKAKNDNGI